MALTKISRSLLDTGISDSSDATAITIDSSENVGIGTTSPASNQGFAKTVEISDAGATTGPDLMLTNPTAGTDEFLGQLSFNHANDALASIAVKTDGATDSGHMQFQTQAASGAITERMRIDSSGNVGIGTTSPADRFQVNHTGVQASSIRSSATDNDAYFAVGNSDMSDFILLFGGHSANDSSTIGFDDGNNLRFATYQNHTGTFGAERMRIDSSGNLLVGTTSIGNATTNAKVVCDSEFLSRGSSAGYFWENRTGMTIASQSGWGGWYSTGTSVHSLYSDGSNIVSINRSSGAYTALSDKNKKKDFEDSTVGLAEVMQLQPKKFRMLEDADDAPKKLGFVAQDVENVIPEAYFEDTNEDASGVESTFIGLTDRPIIAALTKAIQEQQEQIEALQSEINTLKGG